MIRSAYILPTGNEIKSGIVLDTDSPMIMKELIKAFPSCRVIREEPIADELEHIVNRIQKCINEGTDLIVMIGGSGEGSKYSEILGEDLTHCSMEQVLESYFTTALYGKNGHMWSKLLCGISGNTLVINVPGPYVEAEAAILAFIQDYSKNKNDLKAINEAMAEAVKGMYSEKFL